VTTSQASVVQPVMILDRRTLNTEQSVTIPLYKVFTKENIIFIFLGKYHLHSSSGIKAIDPSKDKG
jgi:hypothetical protein